MQDARYEVVNRILASRVFARALRQRELLEFLAGKTSVPVANSVRAWR